ncbi:Hsp90 cochaperone [Entophlyctis sp. JEL0112]|nr:Hsp90 cochaperone [Entophlyctis sp. JEL0112]
MGNYEECIKTCDDAVEKGREQRADFKLIAKALARMGTAYHKLNDLPNAIKYYQKSLSEHRTPDVLNKLRDVEKLQKLAEKEAYRNPALSDAARERGNELFKAHDYAGAVKEYTEAIKRNDADPRNFSNRAACYIKLMALPEADRDCDEAIKLDASFAKAYVRKASILVAKREWMKALDMCTEAKEKDVDGKLRSEIEGVMMKAYNGLNEVQSGGANREQVLENAMKNPEVQEILADPIMKSILQQMQDDPAAAKELRNIKDIYTTNREKLSCLPQAEQGNVLVELNVAKSVLNICHTTIVQNAWDRGQDLSVHGWVYNLEDGLIQDLSLCVNRKNEVDDIYAYVTAEAVKPAKRELSKTRTRRSSFLVEKSVTLVPDAVTVNGGVTVSVE